MKIGILTYHRSHNYGALLQAVATRTLLQKMGHDAYFVDYFPAYHGEMYKLNPFINIKKKKIKGVISDIIRYPYRKKRYDKFMSFINKEIIPYCGSVDEEYDLIIYGSDQIWRIQKDLGGFNPIYFGAGGLKTKRNASYAASMGIEVLSNEQKERLKQLVGNLDYISVREESLKELLESLSIRNVNLSLDPTLLLSKEDWNSYINTKKTYGRYLLLYDLMKGSINTQAVYKFAQERNLEVVEIVGTARRKDTRNLRTTDGPYEFLNLINNAEFVVTSSFHGLVFSIIFRKQFYASYRQNSSRAESLLGLLGLRHHLLTPNQPCIPDCPGIDYDNITNELNLMKEESLRYLYEICK